VFFFFFLKSLHLLKVKTINLLLLFIPKHNKQASKSKYKTFQANILTDARYM